MHSLEQEALNLREVQRLEGHTDRVWSLAWNPATGADGVPAVLASCSGDKTVRIWQQRSNSSTFDCKVCFLIFTNKFSLLFSVIKSVNI
ncbi:putative transcription factor WD40-like family [Helianthus debilis subsp. tardiflorus]